MRATDLMSIEHTQKTTSCRKRRRTRKDDVLDFICRFALENCGATPTIREIGDGLGLSKSRVSTLMLRLQAERKLTFINRYTYRVDQSTWEPPPYVQI